MVRRDTTGEIGECMACAGEGITDNTCSIGEIFDVTYEIW